VQKVKISAQIVKGDAAGRKGEIEFDLPESTTEAVKQFTEEVVFSRFKSALVIDLQSFIRVQLSKEKPPTPKELQDAVNGWEPGVRQQGKSAAEKADNLMGKLTSEERKALFDKYMADQKAAGARGKGR
jgi:hypothetical protein